MQTILLLTVSNIFMTIENHPGSDYPGRVLHLLGGLSEGRVEKELSGRFCNDDRCRVFPF